ncbi:GIP, partial [Symbiodinium sp. CCMP2456]
AEADRLRRAAPRADDHRDPGAALRGGGRDDGPVQPPAGLEGDELEAFVAKQAADALEGDGLRTPLARDVPEEPTDEDRALHSLTHIPFARWCSACVRTRSRADAHRPQRVEQQWSVLQVDFYFTAADPEGRPAPGDDGDGAPLCCLLAVDLDTRMVLAVPCPGKGATVLTRCTQELARFTIALHASEPVTIQSDGEPSIKSVVRAVAQARHALGHRTLQRTTPVGDHQDRHGKLPAEADLRAWSHSHASFLYNRFNVVAGLQRTPYEMAHGGKPVTAKLCCFGEVVFGKVPRSFKGEPVMIDGMWVGISEHNGTDWMLTEHGAVQATSVRRASKELQLPTKELLEKYHGLPWEKTTVEKKRRKRAPVVPLAAPLADVASAPDAPVPVLDGAVAADQQGNMDTAGGDEAGSDSDSSCSDELLADAGGSPASKRKADEVGLDDGERQERAAASSEPMVREVETVDADWFEAGAGTTEPSDPSFNEDEWEVVGEPTSEPPNLSDAPPAVLDHEAELYETERLKLMDVLREPAHDLDHYEKLTVTFVH